MTLNKEKQSKICPKRYIFIIMIQAIKQCLTKELLCRRRSIHSPWLYHIWLCGSSNTHLRLC